MLPAMLEKFAKSEKMNIKYIVFRKDTNDSKNEIMENRTRRTSATKWRERLAKCRCYISSFRPIKISLHT
jgi:hypothetical protein